MLIAPLALITALLAAGSDECPRFLEALRSYSKEPIISEELVERPTLDCDEEECSCAPDGDSKIIVCARGPGGSGRFWTVHVGRFGGGQSEYLQTITSTVGWRGIRNYPGEHPLAPLSWLKDVDSDGTPEVILWWSASFGEHTGAENLLFLSAYHLKGGRLVPTRAGTVPLLDEVAAIYRELATVPKNRVRRRLYQSAVAAIEAWKTGTTCAGADRPSR